MDGNSYLASDGTTPCPIQTGGTSAGTQDAGTGTIAPATQNNNTGTNVTLTNPLGKGTTLSSLLLSVLSIVTDTVGPIIVILMLVYVGFKFVAAQGEPGKIIEARQMLLYTVVGALILLGAKIIAMGILATVTALAS